MRIFGDPTDARLNGRDANFIGMLPIPLEWPLAGPFAVQIAEVFVAGAVVGDVHMAGAAAGDVHVPGPAAGEAYTG